MPKSAALTEESTLSSRHCGIAREATPIFPGAPALAVCAKVKIPIRPLPAPITSGTSAALSTGAAQGWL